MIVLFEALIKINYIFYSGLALASAGIIFTRNYLFYSQLIEKELD